MLPLSEKRLRANRANAAESTGRVTAPGKAPVAAKQRFTKQTHNIYSLQRISRNNHPETAPKQA
jgi:hypothetical protein